MSYYRWPLWISFMLYNVLYLPLPVGHISFDVAQDRVDLLGSKSTQLVCVMSSFMSPRTSESFFCEVVLPVYTYLRVQAHFSNVSRLLWMALVSSVMSNVQFCFVSSPELLRVHSVPLSGLIRMLNYWIIVLMEVVRKKNIET